MPKELLAKKVFNTRLSLYVCSTVEKQKGFVPEIVRSTKKFKLDGHLIDYIISLIFPTKSSWKKMCRSLIKNQEVTNWSNRLNADSDFDRFRFLHTNIEKAILWECGNDQISLSHAYLVSKLWIRQSEVSPFSVIYAENWYAISELTKSFTVPICLITVQFSSILSLQHLEMNSDVRSSPAPQKTDFKC